MDAMIPVVEDAQSSFVEHDVAYTQVSVQPLILVRRHDAYMMMSI